MTARSLGQRLVATTASRAAEVDESSVTSTLSELPSVYHEALQAMLEQRPVRLDLSSDDAAWSWRLASLAELLPGAHVAWHGPAMLFTVGGHALGVVVDAEDGPCLRIALDAERRVTEDADGALALRVRPALEPLVAACEVLCVAGCCGLSAFEVAPAPIARWVTAAGDDAARRARRELDVLLAELATVTRPVGSARFNAAWRSGRECAAYLEGMRRRLDDARARRS